MRAGPQPVLKAGRLLRPSKGWTFLSLLYLVSVCGEFLCLFNACLVSPENVLSTGELSGSLLSWSSFTSERGRPTEIKMR